MIGKWLCSYMKFVRSSTSLYCKSQKIQLLYYTYIIKKFHIIVVLSPTAVNTDPCDDDARSVDREAGSIRAAVSGVPVGVWTRPCEPVWSCQQRAPRALHVSLEINQACKNAFSSVLFV